MYFILSNTFPLCNSWHTLLNIGLSASGSTPSSIVLICVSLGIFSIPYICLKFSGLTLLSSNANTDGSFNENRANPLISASSNGISTFIGRCSSTFPNSFLTFSNNPSADKCFQATIFSPFSLLFPCFLYEI